MNQLSNTRQLEEDGVTAQGFGSTTPKSITETCRRIEELTGLPEDWDSYGAKSPSRNALIGAVRWVYEIFQEGTPLPDVFPVPNGNVQLEWSLCDLDIEIEVSSISTCDVIFQDLSAGTCHLWQKRFAYDISELAQAIDLLTERFKSQPIRSVSLSVVN